MALDPGTRRIGVAVSDETGLIATPLAVLERSTRRRDLERVRALIDEYRPELLLIGVPLLSSGDEGPQARQSRLFAELLRQEFGLQVRLWNESYSTVEAHRRRASVGARRRRSAVDAEAAAIFLQDYLDARR
jgi:putative holliday junction resolvase